MAMTIEQALRRAIQARRGVRSHKLTVEEVNALVPPHAGTYSGPYTKPDGRNRWTSVQETATIPEAELPDVPPVTLYPTGHSIAITGGAGSFNVTVTGYGQTQTWSVDQDGDSLSWCHVTTPVLHEPQYEDRNVVYAVDANETGSPRETHFYVNGKTFVVSQG
jgi:hypothetical protein